MKEGDNHQQPRSKIEFGQPLKQRQRQRGFFPEGDDLPLLSGTPQEATDTPFIPEDQTWKQQLLPGMPDIDYDVVREKDQRLGRRRAKQQILPSEGTLFLSPQIVSEQVSPEAQDISSPPVPPDINEASLTAALTPDAPKDDEEKGTNQLSAALKLLESGIEHIIDSDNFRDYLEMMSLFHDYSFGNVMLIRAQRPDATHVAGYNTWKRAGRQVRKGEKGIKIIVPHKVKITDDKAGEEQKKENEPHYQLTRFGVGNVFDISQTDGKPLPTPAQVEVLQSESDGGTEIYGYLETLVTRQGVNVVRKDTGTAKGYYDPAAHEIAVHDDLKSDAAAKTLAHEVAHFVAQHRGFDPKADVETVAESTAFVVLHHFGLDTSSYSFGYVATWAQDANVLKRNLEIIQKTAHSIISGVQEVAREDYTNEE